MSNEIKFLIDDVLIEKNWLEKMLSYKEVS